MNDITKISENELLDYVNCHVDIEDIDRAGKLAASTKKKYRSALEKFFQAGGDLSDLDGLASYASTLSTSGRMFLKAAIHLVSDMVLKRVKAHATPENVNAIQALEYQIQSLQDAFDAPRPKGERLHTWLSSEETERLLATCDVSTPLGLRDWILLALLVSAGLRRQEAVDLKFSDLKTVTKGGRRLYALQVYNGKGDKDRVIPIQRKLAQRIQEWQQMIDGHGDSKVLRAVDVHNDRRITDSLSSVALYKVVSARGALIGKPDLAPHDLRRTFAQFMLDGGEPLPKIQTLLGHKSLATTGKYLNVDVDITMGEANHVPL